MRNREWFSLGPEVLMEVFRRFRENGAKRVLYTPRKEQAECIDRLRQYYAGNPPDRKFLLNCKMRFGKSFTVYKFCEEEKLDRILILTFVPAVESSWRDHLLNISRHYEYYTDDDLRKPDFDLREKASSGKSFVLFLSLQNYLGRNITGNTKEKIEKLRGLEFDLLVFDEYHFGA